MSFDEDDVPLPIGTAVLLRVALPRPSGGRAARGCAARVEAAHHQRYELRLPDGELIVAARDQLRIARRADAARLAGGALAPDEVERLMVYRAVVGSTAWGLSDAASDIDTRGVFLLDFERHASLLRTPSHSLRGEDHAWEFERWMELLTKADPGGIELLWSPEVVLCLPSAERVRARRRELVWRGVLGSFGRYALGQLAKIERRLRLADHARWLAELVRAGTAPDALIADLAARLPGDDAERAAKEAVGSLASSLASRELIPDRSREALWRYLREGEVELTAGEARPKNAYNLIRLLHSGLRLAREGEPLIAIEGPLREELLAIKRAQRPLAEVVAEGRRLAAELEAAGAASALPDAPPVALADELLRAARRDVARRTFAAPAEPSATDGPQAQLIEPTELPLPLPDAVWDWLRERGAADRWLQLGLVGAHAYGFPSPDSDLDLKGIHALPTGLLLGLEAPPETRQADQVVGGVELDVTTHELAAALRLASRGNGNVLERLASPLQLISGPATARLRELLPLLPSRAHARHYLGFLKGLERELAREREQEGAPRAKTLLYAYRVALTGERLLRCGQVVLDLRALAHDAGLHEEVRPLLEAKAQQEKGPSPVDGEGVVARLRERLEAAVQASELPELPPRDALEEACQTLRRGV